MQSIRLYLQRKSRKISMIVSSPWSIVVEDMEDVETLVMVGKVMEDMVSQPGWKIKHLIQY